MHDVLVLAEMCRATPNPLILDTARKRDALSRGCCRSPRTRSTSTSARSGSPTRECGGGTGCALGGALPANAARLARRRAELRALRAWGQARSSRRLVDLALGVRAPAAVGLALQMAALGAAVRLPSTARV